MSELERKFEEMERRLAALTREVAELRGANARHHFENLSDDAVVGKDYVAWRFGCSERAILNGLAGTADIPRFSKCPLKFIKSKVDEVFEKNTKTSVKNRAKEEIEKPKKRRLFSTVTVR